MARRILAAAVFVIALLMLASPAMAFNGYRDTYVLTGFCSTCHYTGGIAPPVYDEWVKTAHANTQTTPISRGSGCAGCHTGNYDPSKHVPTAVGTSTFPTTVTGTQGSGESGFSENFVGCSTCHWGMNAGPNPTIVNTFGTDPADTAHTTPMANMANPAICGQCHARYSATVKSYSSWSWPTGKTAPVAGTVKTQGSLGDFNPIGAAPSWTPAAITDYLSVPTPAVPVGNTFWQGGQSQKAHGQGAVQYEEWMVTSHAGALDNLRKAVGPNPSADCLKCHSTDYRMAVTAGTKPPTGSEAKYGVTCVGCHQPHAEGTQSSVWNAAKNTQLVAPRDELCVECHNSELKVGKSFEPGAEVHHPMKEMMGGYGAIGVQGAPSVHSGRCVECHMVPTGYENSGSAATAGNHVFRIVKPREASTQTVTVSVGGVPTVKNMPYSSCSTCHGKSTDPLATYLGPTITTRQEWTADSIQRVTGLLDAGAKKLGFKSAELARAQIIRVAKNQRTSNQLNLLKGFTNIEFVGSEGSLGIHNWAYTVAIVNKSTTYANNIKSDPWKVTAKVSSQRVSWGAKVKFTGKVTTSSLVAGKGRPTIQMKYGSGWKSLGNAKLNKKGGYSKSLTMNTSGKLQFRVKMPSSKYNLTGYSKTVKVTVQ